MISAGYNQLEQVIVVSNSCIEPRCENRGDIIRALEQPSEVQIGLAATLVI